MSNLDYILAEKERAQAVLADLDSAIAVKRVNINQMWKYIEAEGLKRVLLAFSLPRRP